MPNWRIRDWSENPFCLKKIATESPARREMPETREGNKKTREPKVLSHTKLCKVGIATLSRIAKALNSSRVNVFVNTKNLKQEVKDSF